MCHIGCKNLNKLFLLTIRLNLKCYYFVNSNYLIPYIYYNFNFYYLSVDLSMILKSVNFSAINNNKMATLTSKNLFVGYTTVDSYKSQHLVDIRLVNQDLLNQFNTKPNERVMMPGWGCGVWDYLFEPIDYVRDSIISAAEEVINADTRVQLQNIDVTQQDYGLTIAMTLYYVPFNAIGNFEVNFDNRGQLFP